MKQNNELFASNGKVITQYFTVNGLQTHVSSDLLSGKEDSCRVMNEVITGIALS